MLIFGWVSMAAAVCLWTLATVRMTRANAQSRVPWFGRPPYRSMATNVAGFFATVTLIEGLTEIHDHGSAWQTWLAYGIALATIAVIVATILMHNARVKYGE